MRKAVRKLLGLVVDTKLMTYLGSCEAQFGFKQVLASRGVVLSQSYRSMDTDIATIAARAVNDCALRTR